MVENQNSLQSKFADETSSRTGVGTWIGVFLRPSSFMTQIEADTGQFNVGTREATLLGTSASPGGRTDPITQRWKLEKIAE